MPSRLLNLAYPCIFLLALAASLGSTRPASAQANALPIYAESEAALRTSFLLPTAIAESGATLTSTQAGSPRLAEPKVAEPRLSESKDVPTTPVSQPADAAASPGLPFLHGFNAGITIAGVHDSVVGWSTIASPSAGYSFNDIFSIDATIPIYMFRLAESLSRRPRPDQLLVSQRGELGDVVLGFHAQFIPRLFLYQANIAVTAPTGDEAYGLTTGRCTFDLTNHFERTWGRLTPNLELGVGDSSYLVNRIVNKNYTSLGPLSHFQIGVGVDLFHGISFESDAYENLPIGDQKIYGPSRNGKATVVTGHSVTEDNGFTNSLEVPLDRHTSLSSYYSRSLRLHIDSVAVGISYVLRAPEPIPQDSLDDLFR